MISFGLANKTALVTGSSKGIGLATALALREQGARVLFHGSSPRPAEIPGDCAYLRADLLDVAAPQALLQQAIQTAPELSLLVCNAGSFFDLPFLQMTRERWDQTMQLNVSATYFIAQDFARHLVARNKPGALVIVSSTNGSQAEVDSTAYDASKGALVMMTKSLAMSLAAHGIRVNGVAPGLIRTPLTAPWLDARPELKAHYEKKILLGEIGTPEDCAAAVGFLCSEAARYVTGHILTVDGGLTVGQVGRL